MSTKKQGPKFSVFIKQTVVVEVPLKANDWDAALIEAQAIEPHEVYSMTYDVLEYEKLEITSIFLSAP